MLNIIPDLDQFSLGEPGGPVSIYAAPTAAAKKSAKRACASKASAKTVAHVARRAPAKKSDGAKWELPSLAMGPSVAMAGGFADGPSGPMMSGGFVDGPSGPMM